MTLAPERRTISPTAPHHVAADHASTKPHGINPRLSVTSATPRPQRPALKKSGRPNPAAHLTPEQIEGIGHELDALRKEVMDSRGARDAAYIRKVIKVQRYLEMSSRAVLLFSNVKVKGVRPAWWLGTAGLSVAKILENMEIGHNVMHGQWDWMRDPKIHSTAWEWDNACPERSGSTATTRSTTRSPTCSAATTTSATASCGSTRTSAGACSTSSSRSGTWATPCSSSTRSRPTTSSSAATSPRRTGCRDEEKAKFRSDAQEVVAKIKRQATKDYLVHPALSLPTGSARTTLTANVVANLVRNVWTNTVIICGHFPPGIETFEKTSIEGETRGEWYVRQMLGSGNISGSKAMHVMSGNLSHQIEHHLFPDMPSNRYSEIAPRIRDLMERHDLPYVTGSLGKQAASVYWKVVQLSLPNKVEGRRRRDIVRLAAKKAWRKKSLDRF